VKTSVGLEIGEGGWAYAWAFDLPGCFSRGATPEEALKVLPVRIKRFLGWLSEVEQGVHRGHSMAEVTERVNEPCPVRRGDTRALFLWDRQSPTAEELERALRWMGHSRRTLLSLAQSLPTEVLVQESTGDASREFHDAVSPSIHRIVRHVAGAEYWYLSRIAGDAWLAGEEPADVFQGLELVRASVAPTLRRLFATAPDRVVEQTQSTWSGTFTENWTLRKVLRRTLWHEQFHIEEIRRRLEGDSGDRTAVGTA
jgi:predicted RNase H-like HicB family nuclease/uncharacterized damage-inducible protein DinB